MIDWSQWAPMRPGPLHLGYQHLSGRTFATVINEDFPEHAGHFVRAMTRVKGGIVYVECSCGNNFVIP